MKARALKVFTCFLTAVTTLTLLDFGGNRENDSEVHLQCPSLVYASVSSRFANANVLSEPDDEFEDDDGDEAARKAEEADTEEEIIDAKIINQEEFNLEDYTITAPANYEEIAGRVRGGDEGNTDNTEKENYDGKYVWAKDSMLKVYASDNTNSKVIAQYKKGSKLIRISYSGSWSYVRLGNGKKGYVLSKGVSGKKVKPPTPTPKPIKYYKARPKHNIVYAKNQMNTRAGPGLSYRKISTIKTGTPIVISATTSNGWIKSNKGWYVMKSLTVNYPLTASGKRATPTPTPKPTLSQLKLRRLQAFARYVSGYTGCRYVYGGSSPSGFDCSGFTMYCYRRYFGINLPHGANMQRHRGRKIGMSDLQPGDLIFFDHDHNGKADHVGIYVGGGKMVHASNKKTGVIKVSLSKKKDIIGARRYL